MCYYTSVKTTAKQLREAFNAPFIEEDAFVSKEEFNGFAHPLLPVLAVDNGKSLNLYQWGLLPFWAKDRSIAKNTLNAKSETIFELPSFRNSIPKYRCIVPVTGFYEWKHIGKEKIKHFIHPKEQPFFNLAGIYSLWKDPATNDFIKTFSIVTGEANELMADIHNTKRRMPLMIDNRNIDAWIDPSLSKDGIISLMQPCDDSQMAAEIV
jgi:putative SOS response-associated peptidase YedK